ncbi:MAG TPA: hypothetical protein VFF49_06650 [Thermodesulfobacteriota bacterium]|nr:hypothetical protein [Thermodesulfobacteriota bacterium]
MKTYFFLEKGNDDNFTRFLSANDEKSAKIKASKQLERLLPKVIGVEEFELTKISVDKNLLAVREVVTRYILTEQK